MYTAVDVVLRRYISEGGVAWNISGFIGLQAPPNLSLNVACTFASLPFLDWLWSCCSLLPPEKRTPWSLCNFLRSDPYYNCWEFSKSIEVAASKGDFLLVKWLFSHFSVPASASTKELNVGYWALEAMIKAVENGHDDIVRWFLDTKFHELNDDERVQITECALRVANFELVDQLLLSDGSKCVLDYDRLNPGPELIEWMHDLEYFRFDQHLAASAIRDLSKTGHLEMMQQIWQLHSPLLKDDDLFWMEDWCQALKNGCEIGDLLMTRWLFEHPIASIVLDRKPNVTRALFRLGIKGDHVEILEYLYVDQKINIPESELTYAAKTTNLHSSKWLLTHLSHHWAIVFAKEVASHGSLSLELVQLIRQLESLAVKYRTKKRELDIHGKLLWPDTKDLLTAVAKEGDVTTLEWLDRHGLLNEIKRNWLFQAIHYAVANGNFEVVQWLHLQLFSEELMVDAASNTYLEYVKLVYANDNFPRTSLPLKLAAEKGDIEVIKWMLEDFRFNMNSYDAFQNAVANGHLQVVHLLHRSWPGRIPAVHSQSFKMLLFVHVNYPHEISSYYVNKCREQFTLGTYRNKLVQTWLDENYKDNTRITRG